LKPVRKSFNSALYQAYDAPAREALVNHLTNKGHVIVSQSEDYFADVVSQKHGYTYFNEAEVKVAWDGDWPTHWADIRIPERKQRLLDKYEGVNGVLNFYVFNRDLSSAWRIKDTLLKQENLREAYGRNIRRGEKFFHIPYTEAQLIVL